LFSVSIDAVGKCTYNCPNLKYQLFERIATAWFSTLDVCVSISKFEIYQTGFWFFSFSFSFPICSFAYLFACPRGSKAALAHLAVFSSVQLLSYDRVHRYLHTVTKEHMTVEGKSFVAGSIAGLAAGVQTFATPN
jgi:hypothetical protein